MAMRMGGAMAGKRVGERLLDAGLSTDEALGRIVDSLGHCNVGRITTGETKRVAENCENSSTVLCTTAVEPSCYFTTGFLNGPRSAVKGQHVREVKCIAAGDPYCQWGIT
jgi:predicted hydrocarbon binding protein